MKYLFLMIGILGLSACVAGTTPIDDRNSSLTQGSVQMNVVEGKTTKAEILEAVQDYNNGTFAKY